MKFAGQGKALDDLTVCLETLISVLETSIKKSLGCKNLHHILKYIYWVIKAKGQCRLHIQCDFSHTLIVLFEFRCCQRALLIRVLHRQQTVGKTNNHFPSFYEMSVKFDP